MRLIRFWWRSHMNVLLPTNGSAIGTLAICFFGYMIGFGFYKHFNALDTESHLLALAGSVLATELFLTVLICPAMVMARRLKCFREPEENADAKSKLGQENKRMLFMLPIFLLSIAGPTLGLRLIPSVDIAVVASAGVIAAVWIWSWASIEGLASPKPAESTQ